MDNVLREGPVIAMTKAQRHAADKFATTARSDLPSGAP